ncbi:MAG: N,N-dimethylformamidase [Rhodospirillaceae bacterium]|jgi:N,N-dimethylformamidase|nr:N,N-dimethylformamidase [Rhodospirillaceae bacterium]MBT6203996.1 N,N-dimethylformamidase [Rhodospirillaceae bacterium]
MRRLLGYTDEISVQPGQTLNFKVSSEDEGQFDLKIVHIRSGDDSPGGPGLKQRVVDAEVNGTYPARYQATQVGSFVSLDRAEAFALESFTIQALIWPTLLSKDEQTVMGNWDASAGSGYAIVMEGGKAALKIGDGSSVETLTSGAVMHERRWYFVAASFDAATGEATLVQEPLVRYAGEGDKANATSTMAVRPGKGARFLIAAHNTASDGAIVADGLFNGKIDTPSVVNRALSRAAMERLKERKVPRDLATDVVALWDLSKEMNGIIAHDVSANRHHGALVNMPTRAMKGWNHDGSEMVWTHKPEHYGAIHFHDDDLYDCGWESDASWTVPQGTKSGTYCVELTQGDQWFYISFYVRPPTGKPTAKLALLVATCSYYAYVNHHMAYDWGTLGEHSGNTFAIFDLEDMHLHMHPEHGLSMYDNHSDGSGVAYSSRLRPFMHMGPRDNLWQYNADTHITDWLEEKGIEFDVFTDDDMHAEGVSLLEHYDCVMTTTHPEYYTTEMMHALLNYQQKGGRFIYMGGNGFYWRVALHPTLPGAMEMRRAEDGMRSWIAEGGEYYMSFTGELGGLWRRNGLSPEAICGTGFAAQGFNFASHYLRTDASEDPRASWMFKGIGRDEKIGDFGTVLGGAAGSEIDSINHEEGTPPHALVVAEATEFGVDMHWVKEEFNHSHSAVNGENCPHVRCDMVFYETPNGGAVFSTSSIAFAGSLAHDNYSNNVSRLLENVVTRFIDEEPIPAP